MGDVQRTNSGPLEIVPLTDLKEGDEFFLIDGDAWTFEGATEYRDVVKVSNMNKRLREARLGSADARYVVVKRP